MKRYYSRLRSPMPGVLLASLAALLVVALAGCGTLQVGIETTPTQPVPVATTPTVQPPTNEPTQPAADATPTLTPAPPTPAPAATETSAPVPTQVPTPTSGQVTIFLVALSDNGQTGQKIGCDDSLVPVQRQVSGPDPLTAAYQDLLAIRTQFYGQSGLYNAMYQSNLQVASATIAGGKATIELTGTMMLGGVCDNPRAQAQLEEIARQFPGVTDVVVTVNGVPLAQVLSLKG